MASDLFPGVYSREIDRSQYAQRLSATTLALVGVAHKGPLHTPTLVTSPSDLIDTFGAPPNLSAGNNERQLLSFSGFPTGGSFIVYFRGTATASQSYSSSYAASTLASALNTAINTALGTSALTYVTVAGNNGGPFTIEFINTLGLQLVDLLSVSQSLTGGTSPSAAISSIVRGSTPPGDYAMHAANLFLRNGQRLYFVRTCATSNGAWLATSSRTGLPNVDTLNAVEWDTSGTRRGFIFQATSPGDWSNDIKIRFTKVEGAQNEIQTLTLTGFVANDTFTLSYGGTASDNITYSASASTTASNIQSALNTLLASIGGVGGTNHTTVTSLGSGTFKIEFTGTTVTNIDQPLLVFAVVSSSSGAGTVVETQTGRTMASNVYRVDVLTPIDNSGTIDVAETFDRVMLINDVSTLANSNAYWIVDAINKGVTNGPAKSQYITISAESYLTANNAYPVNPSDINAELCTTAEATAGGRLYNLDGGFAALNTTAGDFAAAYVGTDFDSGLRKPTGLQALANPEQLAIDIFAVPGVTNAAVLAAGVTLAESRRDSLFLFDTPSGLTDSEAIAWHNKTGAYAQTGYKANSSFAAVYWGWQHVYDTYNKADVVLPPTCLVPGQFAFSASIESPYAAVAGPRRGVLTQSLGPEMPVPSTSRLQTMYTNGNVLNPILNQQTGAGIMIYGQKTTQRRASALDRINVRTTLLQIGRSISTAMRNSIVFEPNDPLTQREVVALCTSILSSVKNQRGIYDFSVVCDDTINTDDVKDNNELQAIVFIKPTKTAERIRIDLTLLSTGAAFSLTNG